MIGKDGPIPQDWFQEQFFMSSDTKCDSGWAQRNGRGFPSDRKNLSRAPRAHSPELLP